MVKEHLVYVSTNTRLHILTLQTNRESGQVTLHEQAQVDYKVDIGSWSDLCIFNDKLYIAGDKLNDGFLSVYLGTEL